SRWPHDDRLDPQAREERQRLHGQDGMGPLPGRARGREAARGPGGGLQGEVRQPVRDPPRPKFVPITFAKKAVDADGLADEYLIEIPDTLSLKNSVFKDEDGKRTVRLNSSGAMIPAQYYSKAVHHTYRDEDWKTSWDFAGRQSFYGKF